MTIAGEEIEVESLDGEEDPSSSLVQISDLI